MTEALQYSLKSGSLIPPVADSFLYMAEPINIVKFKNKIKKKRLLWLPRVFCISIQIVIFSNHVKNALANLIRIALNL